MIPLKFGDRVPSGRAWQHLQCLGDYERGLLLTAYAQSTAATTRRYKSKRTLRNPSSPVYRINVHVIQVMLLGLSIEQRAPLYALNHPWGRDIVRCVRNSHQEEWLCVVLIEPGNTKEAVTNWLNAPFRNGDQAGWPPVARLVWQQQDDWTRRADRAPARSEKCMEQEGEARCNFSCLRGDWIIIAKQRDYLRELRTERHQEVNPNLLGRLQEFREQEQHAKATLARRWKKSQKAAAQK